MHPENILVEISSVGGGWVAYAPGLKIVPRAPKQFRFAQQQRMSNLLA
jgi:hypothetical protein